MPAETNGPTPYPTDPPKRRPTLEFMRAPSPAARLSGLPREGVVSGLRRHDTRHSPCSSPCVRLKPPTEQETMTRDTPAQALHDLLRRHNQTQPHPSPRRQPPTGRLSPTRWLREPRPASSGRQRLSGFDAIDGTNPIEGAVERDDAVNSGSLGARRHVGLGAVDSKRLVDVQRTQQQMLIQRADGGKRDD